MPHYSQIQLTPFSVWCHVKTSSLYVVLGIATQSTNGPGEHEAKSVVYYSQSHGHWCHRSLDEFLDGRFCPVTSASDMASVGVGISTRMVPKDKDKEEYNRLKYVAQYGDRPCPNNVQGHPCIFIDKHPGACANAGDSIVKPIRCQNWPKGKLGHIEQCALPYEHEGKCMWGSGD